MIAEECNYQTTLPWKMRPILQCRVNTRMFFCALLATLFGTHSIFFMGCLFRPTDIFLAITIRLNFIRHETPKEEQIQKWLQLYNDPPAVNSN